MVIDAFPDKLEVFRRDRKQTWGDVVDGNLEDWAWYVRKDLYDALQAKLEAAEDRALRYKSERNGQARKISDAQNLSTASLDAEHRIANQRAEIKAFAARIEDLELEIQCIYEE